MEKQITEFLNYYPPYQANISSLFSIDLTKFRMRKTFANPPPNPTAQRVSALEKEIHELRQQLIRKEAEIVSAQMGFLSLISTILSITPEL
ncbi:hypothetical protein EON65_22515 [archaeon]|nr:MAG: hypothetical protein EON65_22515 [archaeon]